MTRTVVSRRATRELVVQTLFALQQSENMEIPCADSGQRRYLDYVWSMAETAIARPASLTYDGDYAVHMLDSLKAHLPQIDAQIVTRSSRPLAQVDAINLAIVRLALCEAMFCAAPVPREVIINEAVRLCKRYGTADSYRYVNGLLDTLLAHKLPDPVKCREDKTQFTSNS